MTSAQMPDRFWSKVVKGGDDDCWRWSAKCAWNGYGQFRLDGRIQYAHRVSYALMVGPIEKGLDLDHVCRRRDCVNPNHLRPCTRRQNIHAPGSLCVAAMRARVTHCPRGHEYSGENLRMTGTGSRRCAACSREKSAERRQRSAA